MTRLLYLVSHPIQYQAPLLRLIADQPDIQLRVAFERDPQQSGTFDPGFGRDVIWDVPLRDGYDNGIIGDMDMDAQLNWADAVWMHGWQSPLFRRLLRRAGRGRLPVLMRGENCNLAMPDPPGLRGMAKRAYLRQIFRHCRAFLAIGSANRDYYLDHGIGIEQIFPMPYAIDNGFFAHRAAQADTVELRRRLGMPGQGKVILYAGKFSSRKNPHILLQAWRQASWPDGLRPDLVFVGDGELANQLRAMAGPGVYFAGFRNQSELPAFYALADIFVLASHAEPWGLAVNEAMACGTAVVVSDQCGCARDLVDDDCGAVVAAGDVAALATALVRVCRQSSSLGQAAARRLAEWDFRADVAGLRQALDYSVGARG